LAHVINLAAQQVLVTLKADEEAPDEEVGSLIKKVNIIVVVVIII
jgi:hypothetical protein